MLWRELWMDAGYGWKSYSFCFVLLPSKCLALFALGLATLVNPCLTTSGNTPTMAEALPQPHWLIHADSRNRDIYDYDPPTL